MHFIECHPALVQVNRSAGVPEGFRRKVLTNAIGAVVIGIALKSLGYEAMAAEPLLGQQMIKVETTYEISPGPLAPALRSAASSANVLLTFTAEQTEGKQTAGLRGKYSVGSALSALLDGTGLQAKRLDNGAYVLRNAGDDADVLLPSVMVGAQTSNPAALSLAYAGGQVATGSQVGVLGQKSAMDTPFSTVSYTQQKIQDDQARSVAEVLFANDPSVRASIGSSNRYDAFTIRGFRVANSDVALNGLYGLVPNWRVGTKSVERIELLKGPGAFLYGMAPGGGVGGGVNLVTKRAEEEPITRLTTSYSSEALFGEHLDVGRRFGGDNQFGARLNASITDGQTPYDGESLHGNDVSLGLDYVGDHLRLSGDFIYQHDRTSAQERGYSVTPGIVVPSAPNPKTNLSQSYDFAVSDSTTALIRGEYDLSDRLTAFLAIGVNTFGFEKRETPGGTILNTAGDVRIKSNALQKGEYRTVTGEAGLRGLFETGPFNHQATVSVSGFDQDYDLGQASYADYVSNIYTPVRVSTPATTYYPVSKASELSMHSIALADVIGWHDDLVQFGFGARQQFVESKSYSGTTGLMTRRYDDQAIAPMLGVVIRPIEALSLYANYVEGLTPGPTPPSTAINSQEVFAPFKSKQYELGAKLDFGRFGVGLSAFQIEMPNGLTDANSRVFSLDGLQRNRGLELTSFGELASSVRVLGGATVFDARQVQTAGGSNDGRFAVGVPRMQANLGTEWDVPSVNGLTLTSKVIYTGEVYVDAANQQSVPSWTRFDLGARYGFKFNETPLVVRGTVTNVANRRYWEANPSGYLGAGAPRIGWLSLTVDF